MSKFCMSLTRQNTGPAAVSGNAATKSYFLPAFFAVFAKGDGALPARMAAQRRLAASAIAFRPAALRVRLPEAAAGAEAGAEAGAAALTVDPGGRPRRLTEPCSASIARDRRSRSATSKATICSVCIKGIVTFSIGVVQNNLAAARGSQTSGVYLNPCALLYCLSLLRSLSARRRF
jgi:hypothetical protein